MWHVMLSPADLIVDTWPRSSQYLHHFFCLFILFMLHFFYLVDWKLETILLLKIFSRVFSSPSWFEWIMKLQWTLLKILSTEMIFTELISVEVRKKKPERLLVSYIA